MGLPTESAKELYSMLNSNIQSPEPNPKQMVYCMEGLYLHGSDLKNETVAKVMRGVGQLPAIQQEIASRLEDRDSMFASGKALMGSELTKEAFAQVVDLSMASFSLGYCTDPKLGNQITALAVKYGVLPPDYTVVGDAGYYELKPVAGVNIIEQAKEYLAHSKKMQETLSGDPESFIGYLKTLPPIPINIPGAKEFVGRIGPKITAEPDGDRIWTQGIFLANETEAPFDAVLQIDQKGRIKVLKKEYDLSNFNFAVRVGAPLFIDRIIGNIDSQLTGIINKNIGEGWQVGYYGLKDNKMSITFVKKAV